MPMNLRHRFIAAALVLVGLLLCTSTASSGTLTGPITGGSHGWAFGSPAGVVDLPDIHPRDI